MITFVISFLVYMVCLSVFLLGWSRWQQGMEQQEQQMLIDEQLRQATSRALVSSQAAQPEGTATRV